VPAPGASRRRILLDPSTIDRNAALREITAGHFAALDPA
jgi:hypothetical protein